MGDEIDFDANFATWLRGFIQISGGRLPNDAEWEVIKTQAVEFESLKEEARQREKVEEAKRFEADMALGQQQQQRQVGGIIYSSDTVAGPATSAYWRP